MSSGNLSIADPNSLDDLCEVLSNKETQTSSAYITESFQLIKGPSRPLPKGISKSDIAGTVNILDCKVIKDPSDSKITAEFTESFVRDIENSSISDGILSPSKYCKEVVRPYLKTHLNDCEDNTESLEKLIQNALEDLPDYQPSFEVYEGKEDIKEKISINKISNMENHPTSKNQKEDPPKSFSAIDNSRIAFANRSKVISPSHSTSKDINKTAIKPAYPDDVQQPTDNEGQINNITKIRNNLSRESITKCVKENLIALKRSASSCLEKIEVVMGIKTSENPDEKPIYYPIEKKKLQYSDSRNVQTETGNSLNSVKNLFNNHQEKINTIKESVKNISGKFYKTSKDAVTFITSESAKLLNKNRAEVPNSDDVNENRPKKVNNLGNMSANSITSFLFQKAENKPIKDEAPQNVAAIEPPKKALSSLAIAPRIRQIRDDLVTAKFERSSSYDKPMPKEVSNKLPETPESRIPTVSAIEHTPDPPMASNMFTIIKSKIFSMFRDEIDKSTEPVIQESSQAEDEEEDPFEKFMEQ